MGLTIDALKHLDMRARYASMAIPKMNSCVMRRTVGASIKPELPTLVKVNEMYEHLKNQYVSRWDNSLRFMLISYNCNFAKSTSKFCLAARPSYCFARADLKAFVQHLKQNYPRKQNEDRGI